MSGNFLYMETGDCHLVSLNREDGKLRWSKPICDLDQFYFASVAPVVVGNHVIAGVSGDDSDVGGYLESHDPETGELQWRFYTVPQKKGDPGMDTWPNEDMASHGGGMTWVPITYDPDPENEFMSPPAIRAAGVIAYANRPGDNLPPVRSSPFMPIQAKWRGTSRHRRTIRTIGDSTQTPVIFDAPLRRPAAQTNRAGRVTVKFFVWDRVTRKIARFHGIRQNELVARQYRERTADSESREESVDRPETLVSPDASGGTNWFSPSFSPQTGLFCVECHTIALACSTSTMPPRISAGLLGRQSAHRLNGWKTCSKVSTTRTGNGVKWSHKWEGGSGGGLLTTAGNLIFSGAPGGAIEALNATTGAPLWHARLANGVSAPPTTWELDGTQYMLVGSGVQHLYASTFRHADEMNRVCSGWLSVSSPQLRCMRSRQCPRIPGLPTSAISPAAASALSRKLTTRTSNPSRSPGSTG